MFGTEERPRLVVFRSLKHIYGQIINDVDGKTLVASSTLDKDYTIDKSKKKVDVSFEIGELLGKKAKEKGISKVNFDRNGYHYHGRIKAFADGARKSGLDF